MSDDRDATEGGTGRHRSSGGRRTRTPAGSARARDGEDPRGTGRSGERDDGSQGSKTGAFFRELAVLVVLVLALTALLRGLVFEAYMIPSGSMENTLRIGDKVLVNKLVYHFRPIARGDVIVFNGKDSFTPEVPISDPGGPVRRVARTIWQFFGGTPANEEDFTKRVIGLPGDKIECRTVKSGHAMYINGVRLREKAYLYPGDQPCTREFAGRQAVVVPPGRLWVMGDHRSLSADSREHVNDGHLGTVPEDEVIGRAFAIVWPTSHWTGFSQPSTFQQRALKGALPAPGHQAPASDALGASLAAAFLVTGVRRRSRRR